MVQYVPQTVARNTLNHPPGCAFRPVDPVVAAWDHTVSTRSFPPACLVAPPLSLLGRRGNTATVRTCHTVRGRENQRQRKKQTTGLLTSQDQPASLRNGVSAHRSSEKARKSEQETEKERKRKTVAAFLGLYCGRKSSPSSTVKLELCHLSCATTHTLSLPLWSFEHKRVSSPRQRLGNSFNRRRAVTRLAGRWWWCRGGGGGPVGSKVKEVLGRAGREGGGESSGLGPSSRHLGRAWMGLTDWQGMDVGSGTDTWF